jgi:hypothetical protein
MIEKHIMFRAISGFATAGDEPGVAICQNRCGSKPHLAAGLTGAGTGGVAGGLIGALVGSGIREEKAKFYAEEIGQGKILLSVAPHSEAETNRIESEWLDRGSEGVIRQ